RHRRPRPRMRRRAAWVAAFVVPSAISALLATWLDRYLGLVSESALYFVAVLAVALFGGVLPAIAAALLAGLLLNVLFTDPRYSITIQEPNNFLPAILLLVVAVAVAVLVDTAARRAEQAGQASREAELLTLFAGSVLRGTDLTALLDRLRQTYGQRAVTLRHHTDGVIAAVGEDPPDRADAADTAVEVSDGDYWLLLSGPTLRARDRRVLEAVANQAVGLVRQQQLAEEANQAAALAEADRLRRDLLSAVSHDLRTPLAGVKAAISSLRSDDVEFSPEDRAELMATVEESADQLTSLVGYLLETSRLAAGVVRPRLRPVYLDEVVHRALVSVGVSPRGARRGALDRVTVRVGPTAVQADPDLLERILANLVDNALRYGAESPVKVDATTADGRVVVRVVDHGPGLPGTDPERVFDQFQQGGDRDNTSGLGLGLSVVRGFAVAMGGSVTAEPTPGGGLTVTVELADTTGNVGADPLPTEVP
ncbi:MAG: DUF4118 domain-containing protein, partial [Nocardia sp.]|nr:DUF4118 domain-containing protein [Nocardia sp.]